MEEQKKARQAPAWAKAAIVAELDRDDCDSMTDYFATHVERSVLIGWSRSTRDNFGEMRAAVAACTLQEVKHLAEPPDVDSNGRKRTAENAGWWHPADEHREKHSMGHGYYLKAEHRYRSGWVVRKLSLAPWYRRTIDELLADPARCALPESHNLDAADATREVDGATVRPSRVREGFAEVVFPAKPAAAVLDELKAAGYRWSRFSCCWYGPASMLPARYRGGAVDELEAMHRAEEKAEAAAGCRA